MKEVIYNYDCLNDSDVSLLSQRTKALLINGDYLYIGNEDSVFQFIGGHVEENESFEDCLKREIIEETGIDISDYKNINPFMKITYYNKDYPKEGLNQKTVIQYYVVFVNQEPDISKTNYTEEEVRNHFKIEKLLLSESIEKIIENIPNAEKNKVIAYDMIQALEEYFKITNHS